MDYPKISIVTPSYNQVEYIEDTILSIISQQYPNLEYIVIDGGSTDGTVDIIKKYEDHITYWISEKDNGLYDALNKGFDKSTGDVMGWLNSDDILHRRSLYVIADIFANNKHVNWLQGYPTVIDETGRIVYHRKHRYSKYSFYIKEYHDGIFIQQESTYWRRELWNSAGACLSSKYKYAGDFELWIRFFLHAILFITPAFIGAFRIRKHGQISTMHYKSYLMECDKIIDDSKKHLSGEELAVIRKLKLYRKIQRKFPFIAMTFQIKSRLNKYGEANIISIDFNKQQFN